MRPRYKKIIPLIQKLKADYKAEADKIIEEYANSKKKLMDQKDIYSEEGLRISLSRVDELAKAKLDSLRDRTLPLAEHYTDLLGKDLNLFLNGSLNPELSNKAQTLHNLGIELNQYEFNALKDSARSYYDLKIIEKLAKDYNLQYESNFNTNDAVVVSRDLASYKANLLNGFKYYCGEHNELKALVPPDTLGNSVAPFVCSASAQMLNGDSEIETDYINHLQTIYSVLPENRIKTTLTDQDKKLIDSIITTSYSSLAEKQVRDICANSPELGDLLALDSRYSGYVDGYYADNI